MEPENTGLEMAKAFAEGAGKESASNLAEFLSGLFPFWGVTKKAVDVYIQNIEQSNLPSETKMMAIANVKKTFRERKNQAAIIDVAYTALEDRKTIDSDSLKNIDNELIDRLIDSGKFVSDEELQLLCGNVLAGEFENPGSTPKNIVRILSELSKQNANIFSNLCSLQADICLDTGCEVECIGADLMIFQIEAPYLKEMNINFRNIQELEHLGLISFNNTGSYQRTVPSANFPQIHIVSANHVMTVHTKKNTFPCGYILLTSAGKSIARFVQQQYNPQHIQAIRAYFDHFDIETSPTPGIHIIESTKKGMNTEYRYQRI